MEKSYELEAKLQELSWSCWNGIETDAARARGERGLTIQRRAFIPAEDGGDSM